MYIRALAFCSRRKLLSFAQYLSSATPFFTNCSNGCGMTGIRSFIGSIIDFFQPFNMFVVATFCPFTRGMLPPLTPCMFSSPFIWSHDMFQSHMGKAPPTPVGWLGILGLVFWTESQSPSQLVTNSIMFGSGMVLASAGVTTHYLPLL